MQRVVVLVLLAIVGCVYCVPPSFGQQFSTGVSVLNGDLSGNSTWYYDYPNQLERFDLETEGGIYVTLNNYAKSIGYDWVIKNGTVDGCSYASISISMIKFAWPWDCVSNGTATIDGQLCNAYYE